MSFLVGRSLVAAVPQAAMQTFSGFCGTLKASSNRKLRHGKSTATYLTGKATWSTRPPRTGKSSLCLSLAGTLTWASTSSMFLPLTANFSLPSSRNSRLVVSFC